MRALHTPFYRLEIFQQMVFYAFSIFYNCYFKELLPAYSFTNLKPLTPQDGKFILAKWLERDSRTLTPKQLDLVMEAFYRCPLPLFLAVAYEVH